MKSFTAPLLVAAAVAAPHLAHADRRAFTRTYEYMTMPEGQTEVELYSTWNKARFGANAPESHQLQVEIEHGLTERWDISLYHQFSQSTSAMGGTPMRLDRVKLRSRYRFAERGELPIDVLAYGELQRKFGASAYVGEAKAILARDFGMLTVATNLIAEVEFGGDVDEPELELGWAAGVTYEASPAWKIGAETWGDFEPTELDETLAPYAGPAVSWGASPDLWVSATVGFGFGDHSDKMSVRGLIGLSL